MTLPRILLRPYMFSAAFRRSVGFRQVPTRLHRGFHTTIAPLQDTANPRGPGPQSNSSRAKPSVSENPGTSQSQPESVSKNTLKPDSQPNVSLARVPPPASGTPPKAEPPKTDGTAAETSASPSDDFLTTIFDSLEPYIDTYEVYKQLIGAGFTPKQSDEVINLLIFQLNSKLTKLLTIYSQLYELENEQYLFESAQQELNVDITRNREHHINDAINQINALQRDYGFISDELNNHFIQMKNDIQVAINDQRSENTLMSKKIMLRLQETNHKITTELNMAMRSEIESLRWHLSRWGLIAILMSIVTACVAFTIHRARHQKRMSEKNEFVPLVIYEPSEFDEDDYHADLDPNAL